jgi:hypothetical protein
VTVTGVRVLGHCGGDGSSNLQRPPPIVPIGWLVGGREPMMRAVLPEDFLRSFRADAHFLGYPGLRKASTPG